MKRSASVLALALLPAAGAAQEPPLPGYFVTAVFEVSTAQSIARSCETLSIDPILAARRTETILGQLTRDGFTPENIQSRMTDPSNIIGNLQEDFMRRHTLSPGAPQDAVCAAGRHEIAETSGIGALLLEVTP